MNADLLKLGTGFMWEVSEGGYRWESATSPGQRIRRWLIEAPKKVIADPRVADLVDDEIVSVRGYEPLKQHTGLIILSLRRRTSRLLRRWHHRLLSPGGGPQACRAGLDPGGAGCRRSFDAE
jgi:hypothetical protein